ncbi:hypothetical protein CY34DRAFT_16490 [Suillus luteus UH-Slu-Lm8-n1]|uniref:Uncharacterized protein n=1 Tax=Suillus luteus UH-Slu-Lm8-n1 TaxID=930992 RepID=A0A0D0ADR3_9AGAM|nr:hypothetical protein CY34DRAFT_16490 [Suillus luteus UH-Slu-Lm8-n1]
MSAWKKEKREVLFGMHDDNEALGDRDSFMKTKDWEDIEPVWQEYVQEQFSAGAWDGGRQPAFELDMDEDGMPLLPDIMDTKLEKKKAIVRTFLTSHYKSDAESITHHTEDDLDDDLADGRSPQKKPRKAEGLAAKGTEVQTSILKPCKAKPATSSALLTSQMGDLLTGLTAEATGDANKDVEMHKRDTALAPKRMQSKKTVVELLARTTRNYNANHEPLVVCARCHRTKYKCGGNGSAPPTKRPAANRARSKSCRRIPAANVTGVTDDEGAEGDVAATTTTITTTTTTTTTATPAATPAIAAVPATTAPIGAAHDPVPDSQTVLVLKKDLTVLQEMVASLVEREANVKLLADQVTDLQQEALPVVMRTDSADSPAATTTQPEDEAPAASNVSQDDDTPSVTTAPQEDGVPVEQDMSPVVATAMQVDESPANGNSQGEAASPDTGGVEESASIASTVHE